MVLSEDVSELFVLLRFFFEGVYEFVESSAVFFNVV